MEKLRSRGGITRSPHDPLAASDGELGWVMVDHRAKIAASTAKTATFLPGNAQEGRFVSRYDRGSRGGTKGDRKGAVSAWVRDASSFEFSSLN